MWGRTKRFLKHPHAHDIFYLTQGLGVHREATVAMHGIWRKIRTFPLTRMSSLRTSSKLIANNTFLRVFYICRNINTLQLWRFSQRTSSSNAPRWLRKVTAVRFKSQGGASQKEEGLSEDFWREKAKKTPFSVKILPFSPDFAPIFSVSHNGFHFTTHNFSLDGAKSHPCFIFLFFDNGECLLVTVYWLLITDYESRNWKLKNRKPGYRK